MPDIAIHLKEKIVDAHATNKKFKEAYASFIEMCHTALNPGIQQDAVDDMLVQHLLTERLIREIFDNPEFTRRNAIAAEIEKVIDAFTSRSFDRHVFLRSLDRFYVAIENAARTFTEWSDKQHFLNTVYERFFQGYGVKLADTMGIVYTPQPIVDFMCASVAEVLEKEFGKSLGDKDVHILDPCTGTGNFIVNLIRRIPKRALRRVYTKQLFANEIMLLPYYIAALNIEHAYYEQTGEYEAFDGLCFVDTLDLAEPRQNGFSFMTEKNTERVERQKRTPITVIIGNPPYNTGQKDENENNKNRKYPVLEDRIRFTYAKESKATNKNALGDSYVKFFRWASDRLEERDGVVCFVSNNSFVEQLAFDGFRKRLLSEFQAVYHLHLEGNVRQDFKLAGSIYNVFGIQVGVGVTLAVKRRGLTKPKLMFHRISKMLRREEKLKWLATNGSLETIDWKELRPASDGTWLSPEHVREFGKLIPIASKLVKSGDLAFGEVFATYSGGVKTNRDEVVYDFQLEQLKPRVAREIDDFNAELDRYNRKGRPKDIDAFVDYTKVKWSEALKAQLEAGTHVVFEEGSFRACEYRPFTTRWLYFDDLLVERRY